MSLLTKGIGAAKKVKHRLREVQRATTPVYLSPVYRIERVRTDKRVCAMTFDDGPCRLPAQPGGACPLTEQLAQTLEKFGARGTFDVIGDTSSNYPDTPGTPGNADWGGVAYDHYPDFQKDAEGGACHCPELIDRLLRGGHEITSHTYSHVLFGKKPWVYGKRHYLGDFDRVVADLQKLDQLLSRQWNYRIRLSRPPHYVDKIEKGLTAYDAYAVMGYQYMAASFDGAGWLPLSSYEAEVQATYLPLRDALEKNSDAFCGQIIFQKDGYNMARRTPVADGLEKQLELLDANGYQVVTVSELLAFSPFADVGEKDPIFPAAKALHDADFCVTFRDGTVRPQQPVTTGELAMILWGKQSVAARIEMIRKKRETPKGLRATHPYSGALSYALQAGCMQPQDLKSLAKPLTRSVFDAFCREKFGASPSLAETDDISDRLTCYTQLAALAGKA